MTSLTLDVNLIGLERITQLLMLVAVLDLHETIAQISRRVPIFTG